MARVCAGIQRCFASLHCYFMSFLLGSELLEDFQGAMGNYTSGIFFYNMAQLAVFISFFSSSLNGKDGNLYT